MPCIIFQFQHPWIMCVHSRVYIEGLITLWTLRNVSIQISPRWPTHSLSGLIIPETEKPQEAKRVCLDKPARHAFADPGRYFTQKVLFFPRNGLYVLCLTYILGQ